VHAHIDGGEELAVILKRRHHVENLGPAEGQSHHRERIGLEQLLVVGARRQRLGFVVGVGAQQRHALAVADIDVVNRGRIAVHRFERGLERQVVAHGLSHHLFELAGMVGVDGAIPQAVLQRILQRKPYLPRHHQVGVVGLLHCRFHKLVHVDERNQPRDEKHQSRNRQHEFGLQTHE
jgi:hypothetical protein